MLAIEQNCLVYSLDAHFKEFPVWLSISLPERETSSLGASYRVRRVARGLEEG